MIFRLEERLLPADERRLLSQEELHMKSLIILGLLFALLILSGPNSVIYAQEITGSIVGTVTDTSGAIVPGATITITDPAKRVVLRTIVTGDDGTFSAPQLPAAVYEVVVEAPNFKKHVETGVKLDVNQRRAVEIVLQAGNIAEVVRVAADKVAVGLSNVISSSLFTEC